MKTIEFVDTPPALSCHADVVAKDILPTMSVTIIDNGRGCQIRAVAAGSATFQGRPVRIWIITIWDESEGHRILTVTHAHCDVSRSAELAEVREIGKAAWNLILLDGGNGGNGKNLQ